MESQVVNLDEVINARQPSHIVSLRCVFVMTCDDQSCQTVSALERDRDPGTIIERKHQERQQRPDRASTTYTDIVIYHLYSCSLDHFSTVSYFHSDGRHGFQSTSVAPQPHLRVYALTHKHTGPRTLAQRWSRRQQPQSQETKRPRYHSAQHQTKSAKKWCF